MEIILKGEEKNIKKLLKVQKIFLKRNQIEVIEKEDKPIQKRQSKKVKQENKE